MKKNETDIANLNNSAFAQKLESMENSNQHKTSLSKLMYDNNSITYSKTR